MTDRPSTEAANAGIEHGTLEHLDPTLLDIGDNVRDDAALSKDFIASIAELGVLVPITGVRDPERSEVVRVRTASAAHLLPAKLDWTAFPSMCCHRLLPMPIKRPSTASCTKSSPTIKRRTSPTRNGRAAFSR